MGHGRSCLLTPVHAPARGPVLSGLSGAAALCLICQAIPLSVSELLLGGGAQASYSPRQVTGSSLANWGNDMLASQSSCGAQGGEGESTWPRV